MLNVKCPYALLLLLVILIMHAVPGTLDLQMIAKKLQVCQNKVVRFILDLPPMHSINYSVLSGLNLLNVEDRVTQLRLNHVFNIYQGKAPSYLSEHFY